ncbi:Tfx family DNA-binding protein [Halovenus sp. WSH3]|uniref:Tfx family DNA-binding protein n=1 Tax=Halovenus carboxidivorans TaxID=2692199 RepID=A0A6B0TAI0_9EURY|nr:Tfx family DNA-binding protein [Halovenus carboxidivorans]MXR50189.1 Tfx family DNA-binding protein [Halovenus carboxidivorans]
MGDEPDDDGGTGGTDLRNQQDAAELLEEIGFEEERTLLTRRQAEVLVMREHGLRQADIADRLGTTRENITGIENRARENVEKARETVEFSELLSAPVRVEIPAGTDLYETPDLVFDACDDADITVTHNAPELMKRISDAAGSAVDGRQIRTTLSVNVTSDGRVRVRKP